MYGGAILPSLCSSSKVLFIAFLEESLSSLQIGSQTVWHVLHLSYAEIYKAFLGFRLHYAASLMWKVL